MRFGSVFPWLGISMGPQGITRLRLIVNGMGVLDAQGLGVPGDQDRNGFQTVDVARYFETVPQTYYDGLRQRAFERGRSRG